MEVYDSITKALAAVGINPGDAVEIVTPQFTREAYDPPPAASPRDRQAFELLRELPVQALKELGLRPWGRQEREDGTMYGPVLWLFPAEWYRAIPAGYECVDINFQTERFQPGVTDDDMRFGLLSFGILKEPTPEQEAQDAKRKSGGKP